MLSNSRVRAVVLNSGGANACTGPEGFGDTHATAEHVAQTLGLGAIDVAVQRLKDSGNLYFHDGAW